MSGTEKALLDETLIEQSLKSERSDTNEMEEDETDLIGREMIERLHGTMERTLPLSTSLSRLTVAL